MDKQKVIDNYQKWCDSQGEDCPVICLHALAMLKEQETEIDEIADEYLDLGSEMAKQPKIVRCKDCRWGDWSRNGKGEEMILCYNGDTGIEDGYLHEPDWFCAEGERSS